MANTESGSRKIYWLSTFFFLALTIVMLIWANSWFWAALPFLLTSLVLALDKL